MFLYELRTNLANMPAPSADQMAGTEFGAGMVVTPRNLPTDCAVEHIPWPPGAYSVWVARRGDRDGHMPRGSLLITNCEWVPDRMIRLYQLRLLRPMPAESPADNDNG